MASNATLNPVMMASTISQARLEALGALDGGDPEKFLTLGKHCIDAHAQATKAMIDGVRERVKSGEQFDWEGEIESLRYGLYRYCQAIVKEAEGLIPESLENYNPVTSITTHPSIATRPSVSTKTTSGSLFALSTFTSESHNLSDSPASSSEPQTSLSYTMAAASADSSLLAGSRQSLRLFTISSDDWIKVDAADAALTEVSVPEEMSIVDRSIHLGVVMGILSRLYTMAKMMQTIFLSYGVEPDNSTLGLPFWTRRCEEILKSHDLALVISVTEHLYYSLYARVVIEMANTELCGIWKDLRFLKTRRPFLLPEADHLYRIMLAFKEVLDAPSICPKLRMNTAIYFQENYISQVLDRTKNTDYSLEDPLGYRLHVAKTVSDQTGPYCKKWQTLIPFFTAIPSRNLAMMSEKYLAVVPVGVAPDDVPFDKLPFIDPNKTDEATRDKETIKDHRLATLAKLEGTTIGDERHKDPQYRIYHIAKQHKCVCFGLCRCAKECTMDVVRKCPCAERHVRIMTTKRAPYFRWPGYAFPTTAGTMTRMYFQGLASLKRSVTHVQISRELMRAFESMDALITSEREREQGTYDHKENENEPETDIGLI